MTVYVDEIRDWSGISLQKGLKYTRWCHMVADSRQELHAFASQLGLMRRWFQDDPVRWHYDLTPGRRSQAVRMGAREITRHDLAMLMYLRRQGDRARQVTEDNVVEVFTWHGNCRFHHEPVDGKETVTGLVIDVNGVSVVARFGDWVVMPEGGDPLVCSLYRPEPPASEEGSD